MGLSKEEFLMQRSKKSLVAALLTATAAAGMMTLAFAQADTTKTQTQIGTPSPVAGAVDPQTVINAWPDANKKAAMGLIEKYGQPDLVGDRIVAWHDKQQWKKVAVFRDSVKDPMAADREGFVENVVSYKVPVAKVSDLLKFDQALIIDMPHGTLASLSDSEKSNTIALNLANDVVKGKRTVASAKSMLMSTLKTTMAGKSSPMADSLQFTPMGGSEDRTTSPTIDQQEQSGPQTAPEQQTPTKQGY
jgi:hypothetical protein